MNENKNYLLDEDYELIELYLAQNPDVEVVNRVETRMNVDPDFEQAVLLQKKLLDGFAALRYKPYKEKVASWGDPMQGSVLQLYGRYAVAASIVLAIGIFGTWYYSRVQYSDTALAQKYFTAGEVLSWSSGATMSAQQQGSSEAGLDAFQKGNYPDAIELLKNVDTTSGFYAEAVFKLGLSHFKVGDYDAAIAGLQSSWDIIRQSDKVPAHLTLVCAYIAAGKSDTEAFQQLIINIPAEATEVYKRKMEEIQAELKHPLRVWVR